MDVTIVVPISRNTYLREFFTSLNQLDCSLEKTKLFCYVDGDQKLLEKVKTYLALCKFSHKEVRFRGKGIAPDGGVRTRRLRIADIHNEIKTMIGESTYVFLVEDDTLVPKDALKILLQDFTLHPNAVFFSGIEIGRWGFPIIGGWIKKPNETWAYTIPYGEVINTIMSLPEDRGRVHVLAAGFFCCLIKTEFYTNHHFKPFEQILGPDVNFGAELTKDGFMKYVDYSVRCDHLMPKHILTFDNTKTVQLQLTRNPSDKFGWSQKLIR